VEIIGELNKYDPSMYLAGAFPNLLTVKSPVFQCVILAAFMAALDIKHTPTKKEKVTDRNVALSQSYRPIFIHFKGNHFKILILR
jgi:hypothetical protein